MKFKNLYIAIAAVLSFAGFFAESSRAEPKVVVTIKDPPESIRHCQPYRMVVSAKCNAPDQTMEKFKKSIVWDIQSKGYLLNPQTNKYDIEKIPGHFENKADFGLHAVPWFPHPLVPQGAGQFTATWNIFQYRHKKENTGKNNPLRMKWYDRGSFFRIPGAWNVDCHVTMTITINKQSRTLKGTGSFPVLVFPPQLHVYAVEGCGGAIVPSENWLLNPFNIEKLKEILKSSDVDHLNKGIVQRLKNFQGTEWRYNHLYRELNILKPIMDSIENDIYFDSDCGCNKIALLGYSYGGHEVLKTAVNMRDGFTPTFTKISEHFGKVFPNRKIDVDLMITIDPVEQFVPPSGNYNAEMFKQHSNVKRHINFYQQVDEGSLMVPPKRIKIQGGSINGIPADLNKKFERADFVQHYKGMGSLKDGEDIPAGKLTSHTLMPYLQEVRDRIEAEIKKAVPK